MTNSLSVPHRAVRNTACKQRRAGASMLHACLNSVSSWRTLPVPSPMDSPVFRPLSMTYESQ
jgi:hypothetical protein